MPQGGRVNNDYGQGFYCTFDREMAREWACGSLSPGAFVNHYALEPSFRLRTYNLTKNGNILNWLAVLLKNRRFAIIAPIQAEAKKYILENFLPDLSPYDIIRGYRADDSYFSFASDFLGNTISLSQLQGAMRLGKLGEQVFIKSEKAFEALTFLSAEPVDRSIYEPRRMERDRRAREDYRKNRTAGDVSGAVYIIDILREKWKNDDPRLR